MKISIIVPIYNAEIYLEKCLNSLVNQTYNNIEIILVNDGSKDNSGKICDQYGKNFANIIVLHKKNGGSASARNLGLSVAQGDYIAFVDADDYVNPLYIERMVYLAIKFQADLVQCSFQIIHNYGEELKIINKDNIILKEKNNIELLEAFCSKKEYLKSAVLWNKLIKKEIIKDLKFIEGKGIDDEYLIHKILFKAKKAVVTNEILYYYYISAGSQMRSGYSLKFLDSIEAIEAQLSFFVDINNKRLYNMLLYRYYSSILHNLYMMKKYYGNKKEIIQQLKFKRKKMIKFIKIKEISIKDKFVLLIKRFFPRLVFYIQTKKGYYYE